MLIHGHAPSRAALRQGTTVNGRMAPRGIRFSRSPLLLNEACWVHEFKFWFESRDHFAMRN
jgi:hypothetical protein